MNAITKTKLEISIKVRIGIRTETAFRFIKAVKSYLSKVEIVWIKNQYMANIEVSGLGNTLVKFDNKIYKTIDSCIKSLENNFILTYCFL